MLKKLSAAKGILKIFFMAGSAEVEFEKFINAVFDFTGVGFGYFNKKLIDVFPKIARFIEID